MSAHLPGAAMRLDRAGAVLAGIARHGRARGPIETVDQVAVSVDQGIEGDWRGKVEPGGRGRRQVTLIGRRDWATALELVGRDLAWHERRANLLVEGLTLPRRSGTRIRIGDDVVLEITRECDPCQRMDDIVPGLSAALRDDWRGGACARVRAGGTIAIGDAIRIEE